MKILLAGGTGFVGRYLRWRLAEAGHEVLVLTRRQNPDLPRDSQVLWDGKTVAEPWLAAAGNCAAWI
ncbi:MAG TPA: epimerase, partial [Elusimicrobia bacterium]|nr:epimerase [Elusimicrobiota bacterium]